MNARLRAFGVGAGLDFKAGLMQATAKIDKQNWKSCSSPKEYKLAVGQHTFKVRAVVAGLEDATPDEWSFRLK